MRRLIRPFAAGVLLAAACTAVLIAPARPAGAEPCLNPGCIPMALNDTLCWEGDECPMRVHFDRPLVQPVWITVSTQAITAQPGDYEPMTRRVFMFQPGAQQGSISLRVLRDTRPEQAETVRIVVDDAVNAGFANPSAIITINDARPG
jgi:hypothetical protein